MPTQANFKTDPLTTDEQLWKLILDCLPDPLRDKADRGNSEVKRRSSKMIIRSSDGQYLIEAQRMNATSDGVVYWKLVNRS